MAGEGVKLKASDITDYKAVMAALDRIIKKSAQAVRAGPGADPELAQAYEQEAQAARGLKWKIQKLLQKGMFAPQEKIGLSGVPVGKAGESSGRHVTMPGEYQGGPVSISHPGFGVYPKEAKLPTMRRIISEAKKK